jgi:hypothetical protein
MAMKSLLTAVLLSSLAAGSALAADAVDLSGFDKVLLPLDPTINLVGANGATFETAVRIAPPAPIHFYPKGVNTDATSIGTFEPGLHSDPIAPQSPPSPSGRLLFIEKGKVDDLHLQFWLKTRPAGAQEHESLWTSIPVVRERDFRTGTVVFPSVASPWVYLDPQEVIGHPLAQFRYLLRLYDVDNRGDVELRVKVEELQFLTPTPLSERIVKLSTRRGSDPSQPYLAELPIDPLCHPFSSHSPCTNATMRITIEPVTPGVRYWAMLSLTNNFTQDVTLFWPQ